MKKTFAIFAAFCIISMSACFSPWEGSGDQGTIVIDFGNDGARKLADGDVYTVILTGSGETTITEEIKGLQFRRSVQPGLWNILVRADNRDTLQAYGERDVEVQAGATVNVPIPMKATDATKLVSTWAELTEVFKKNTGTKEIVVITRDLSASSSINFENEKINWNITLRAAKDVTITKSKDIDNSLFRVLEGCELILDITDGKNITINGGGYGKSSLILVQKGTFTMNGGTLTNNSISASNSDKRGGGVTVDEGTFTMKDGTISGNSAKNGGGVRILSGTFTKNGGTIYGSNAGSNSNTATSGGNAVYYDSPEKKIDDTVGPEYSLPSP